MSQPNKPVSLNGVYPHFTVSFLPYDPKTRDGLLLYRGANVRSVRNCYSIPSGLLEHSESFEESIIREMREEIGVQYQSGVDGDIQFHSIYRNVAPEGYDWVIGIWSVPILRLALRAKNMEPYKHDFIYVQHMRVLAKIMENDASPEIAPNLAIPLGRVIVGILEDLDVKR